MVRLTLVGLCVAGLAGCGSSDDQPQNTKNTPVNSNDARIHGATPAEGRYGAALRFDGAEDYLAGSDSALPSGASPSTISVWFNVRRNRFQYLFSYGTYSARATRGLALEGKSGLCFFHWGAGACHTTTEPFVENQWYYWVMTCDGKRGTFYLNGKKQGSDERSFETVLSGYLVGKSGSGNDYFGGRLDELIVFDRVLSKAEIQALHQRSPQPGRGALSLDRVSDGTETGEAGRPC